MKRYAMVKDGIVENIIRYDGESYFSPGPQYILVDLTDTEEPVDIGYLYSNEQFSPKEE